MNTPNFEFPSTTNTPCKTLYGSICRDTNVYLVAILRTEINGNLDVDMKFVAEDELDKFKSEYFYSHPDLRVWSKIN